jgi:hypothetical protein
MTTQSVTTVRCGEHAVVIGGSMAGLLAARVLADHFDRVTVIERDRYPEGPGPRKGVPQARHPHVLLGRGRLILEQLFPGLGTEITAAGAPLLDAADDFAWLTPAGWAIRFRADLRELATVNRVPWLLATGEDFRYPKTTGNRPGWLTRLQQKYVDAVIRLGTVHTGTRTRLLEVLHLLRPPTALFRPGVWLPMLGRALWRRGGNGNDNAPKPTAPPVAA